ncbi:hypothetical protein BP5796_10700 [Coleophoma crateriformis]|uniref:SCP domain-containing protein n=1 Tax=Coleophoma crateriformis TaxID=565419 RepID=A0A3D8QRA0_9HELO|nr:hypothetical protein BP5796_10700 [Coleophoma crateriformis]
MLRPSVALVFLTTLLYHAHTASAGVSTVVVTTTASSAPTATSTQYTSDSDFQSSVLDAHNFYRKQHNASNLAWNATSATAAQSWGAKCDFVHSGGPTGENLAAGYPNASASIDAWALEREQYNWNKPGFSEATGHFTQVVWGNTTSVGCSRQSCQGANGTPGWFVVCEYYPAGNVVGNGNLYFEWNVKKLVDGKLTDTVESGVSLSAAQGMAQLVDWATVLVGMAAFVVASDLTL